MSLVGFRYIQANDPGAVGTGYQWANTSSGILYERNTSNTAWVAVGNVNQTNYGSLARTGGTMTGAISGVTGWAPVDAPDFTTSAKLGGVNLATVNDLSNLQTLLTDLIDQKIASSLSSQTVSSSILANTAISTGVLTFDYPTLTSTWAPTQTIPLPNFPDGQEATESQCKWIVFPTYFTSRGEDIVKLEYKFMDSGGLVEVDPTVVRTFTCGVYQDHSVDADRIGTVKVGYFIIARR